MQRSARKRAAIAATAVLAACAGGTEPRAPFSEPVIVEIDRGTTTRQIADALESHGVIGSKWTFLWERARNRDATLMAGEYLFDRPVPAAAAFRMIADGRVRLYPITVPEGLNRFEIAEVVAGTGMVGREEFLALSADPTPVRDLLPRAQTLEGALFPETYSLARTSTAGDLVNAMLARFREALSEARDQRTADIDDWDALILASMIEEETAEPAEVGLVSSVFHNRIRRGMLMQCDPTIVYGLVLEGRYRGRIYRSDISDPHPYNTYVHGGLPPGPITNPGLPALQAAFAPDESDFLYFVAKPGIQLGHVFSITLGAHNRAVRDLRRYERSVR